MLIHCSGNNDTVTILHACIVNTSVYTTPLLSEQLYQYVTELVHIIRS